MRRKFVEPAAAGRSPSSSPGHEGDHCKGRYLTTGGANSESSIGTFNSIRSV